MSTLSTKISSVIDAVTRHAKQVTCVLVSWGNTMTGSGAPRAQEVKVPVHRKLSSPCTGSEGPCAQEVELPIHRK